MIKIALVLSWLALAVALWMSPPITSWSWSERLGFRDDLSVIVDNLDDCVTKQVNRTESAQHTSASSVRKPQDGALIDTAHDAIPETPRSAVGLGH
jgi:hypothetical protein